MPNCQEQLKVNKIKRPWGSCWHPEKRFCDLDAGMKQPHQLRQGTTLQSWLNASFCAELLCHLLSFAIYLCHCVDEIFSSWTIVFLRPIFFFLFHSSLPSWFFFLLSTAFFPQELNCLAIKAEQICDHPINNQVSDLSEVKTMLFPAPFTFSWSSGEKRLIHCFCYSHHLKIWWVFFSWIILF